MPEDQKKQPVGARVVPAVLDRLKALAAADRRPLSFIVEEAINEYIDRHDKPGRGKR